MRILPCLMLAFLSGITAVAQYSWPQSDGEALALRFAPPQGFQRLAVPQDSFAAWLRNLPLKPGRPRVLLFNGQPKGNQQAHVAVVTMDVGRRDLQQCADAVMRLRAEFLWSSNHVEALSFNFTNGVPAPWLKWQRGFRPVVAGNRVSWKPKAQPSATYENFRKWLQTVFIYAGSASLVRELKPVARPSAVQPGDVFIQGGYPGHAVMVLDVAENADGDRCFLLGQSYMPAQEFHVLHGPNAGDQPWYPARDVGVLETPEWTFANTDLYRFSEK